MSGSVSTLLKYSFSDFKITYKQAHAFPGSSRTVPTVNCTFNKLIKATDARETLDFNKLSAGPSPGDSNHGRGRIEHLECAECGLSLRTSLRFLHILLGILVPIFSQHCLAERPESHVRWAILNWYRTIGIPVVPSVKSFYHYDHSKIQCVQKRQKYDLIL